MPAIQLTAKSDSESALVASPPVIACVDGSIAENIVARHAARLAEALGMPLVLLHALELEGSPILHPDPLDWDLRRHEARRRLMRLRDLLPPVSQGTSISLGEGERAKVIRDAATMPGSILVLGVNSAGRRHTKGRHTAQRVIEAGAENVLLVPLHDLTEDRGFASILIPHDGSSFADAALAKALLLARGQDVELTLAHVVDDDGVLCLGTPDATVRDLQQKVFARNEMCAWDFLDRTRRRLAIQGVKARSLCMRGEARSTLVEAIRHYRPDLVVIAAHGHGCQECPDLSIGGTASYIVSHVSVPTLVVHPGALRASRAEPDRHVIRQIAPAYAA